MRKRSATRRCSSASCPHTAQTRWSIFGGKQNPGQGVELDGRWYCCPDCFEQAAQVEFSRMCRVSAGRQPRQHRVPLGLLLLSRGVIDSRQLQEALEAQRQSRKGRLGKWLIQLGSVNE